MKRILVTGATGTVGYEVIRWLFTLNTAHQVTAGVRAPEKAREKFQPFPELRLVRFDLEDPATFGEVFQETDTLFLLRPPHLADVDKVFRPLIQSMQEHGVREVVFLSVQGAEKSSWVPHHKIEKAIQEAGLTYVFLRPGYFMQNLTTTLLPDIQKKDEIILPAGKARFNWVDTQNIGEMAALILEDLAPHQGKAYEITGHEQENFFTIARLLREVTGRTIRYKSMNPFRFYFLKRKEGLPEGLILVMIALHFLPRLQKNPSLSRSYEALTGKTPTSLKAFLTREKVLFKPPEEY